MDNEPEYDNSVPVTQETSIVSSDESDSPFDSSLTPIRRRISVNPARGGVSRKLIQTMISTPPYKSQKPYMDRGSRKAVFIIDSGASHHVVNDISILDDIIYKGPREDMGRVRGCVSNSGVSIKGYGNIPLIGKTLYAPGIVSNVLSVSQLDKDGFVTTFRQGRCTAVRTRGNVTEEIVGIIFNNKYVA
jgi:hypothetical protein